MYKKILLISTFLSINQAVAALNPEDPFEEILRRHSFPVTSSTPAKKHKEVDEKIKKQEAKNTAFNKGVELLTQDMDIILQNEEILKSKGAKEKSILFADYTDKWKKYRNNLKISLVFLEGKPDEEILSQFDEMVQNSKTYLSTLCDIDINSLNHSPKVVAFTSRIILDDNEKEDENEGDSTTSENESEVLEEVQFINDNSHKLSKRKTTDSPRPQQKNDSTAKRKKSSPIASSSNTASSSSSTNMSYASKTPLLTKALTSKCLPKLPSPRAPKAIVPNPSDISTANIRSLRKLAYDRQMLEAPHRRTGAYDCVREDSRSGVTTQLPSEVEFPKRSIIEPSPRKAASNKFMKKLVSLEELVEGLRKLYHDTDKVLANHFATIASVFSSSNRKICPDPKAQLSNNDMVAEVDTKLKNIRIDIANFLDDQLDYAEDSLAWRIRALIKEISNSDIYNKNVVKLAIFTGIDFKVQWNQSGDNVFNKDLRDDLLSKINAIKLEVSEYYGLLKNKLSKTLSSTTLCEDSDDEYNVLTLDGRDMEGLEYV